MKFLNLLRVAVGVLVAALAGCALTGASIDAARSELAPGGKIRLAVTDNNANYLTQPAKPPYSGVAVDIGNAIARKVGATLEIVVYPSTSAVLADVASGKWQLAIVGVEDSRRAVMDFSVPYAVTQNSYLVPAGSALKAIADVDRSGVRVATGQNTVQHNHLKSSLRSATLVPAPNTTLGSAELQAGRADALAGNRKSLDDMAARMPGFRVLPGSFMDVAYAVAVPKGRRNATALVDETVREMRANGEIAATLKRSGLTGLTVPAN